LVEAFVPGRELTCAVMGDVALGVIDIVPAVGFYDYKAKYAPGGSVHVLPPRCPRRSIARSSNARWRRTWRSAAAA
jgi:D-alanine-D-alanine ligase